MTLDGVDLNLPFDESYSIDGSGELLRMRDTRGTVSFGTSGLMCELVGMIDELSYNVELDYRGLTGDAPFVARLTTSFRIDDRFRPKRFLPSDVTEKLDLFIGTTADIDASLDLTRAQSGARVSLSGEARVRNGSARYRDLPYPFAGISGTVSFTEDEVRMAGIRGTGPSGAELSVEGVFMGLDDSSRVEIDVSVAGMPIDDVLLDALSPGRRQLVGALFNEEQYRRLLDDALVRTPGSEGGPGVPEFVFGGDADLKLQIRREPDRPAGTRWTNDARVTLDRAGLVPERFPLPIVARSIGLRIADDGISLTGGRYEGLTGGSATVHAEIDQSSVRPGRDPLPLIEIEASGIPVDDRLLAAIPGYRDSPREDRAPGGAQRDGAMGIDAVSMRSILDNLRLAGEIECNALIGPRSDGSIGYDIEANLFGASARPRPWSPAGDSEQAGTAGDRVVLEDLDGTVYITERLIVVDLQGDLAAPGTPFVPTPMSLLTQLTVPERRGGLGGVERVGGLLPIQSGPPLPGPLLYADARADGLDLAMPVEHAVAVVSPELADRLHALREANRPDGVIAIRALLEGIIGGHTETVLGLDRIERLAFEHEGVRHQIGPSRGRAELALGVRAGLRFEAFRTPIVSSGDPAGDLSLDGFMPLVRADGLEGRTGSVAVSVRDGDLGSSLTGQLVGMAAGQAAREWLDERTVVGGFDLDVRLDAAGSTPSAHRGPTGSYRFPRLAVVGALEPRTLGFELPEGSVIFDSLGGAISFDGFSGRIDSISAAGDAIALAADGTWSYEPDAGGLIDVGLSLRGERFGEAFRVLMPAVVIDTLDLFEVSAAGPVSTDDLRIEARGLGTADLSVLANGGIALRGASAIVGVPITEMDGVVSFEAEVIGGRASYAVDLNADRMRAGSLRIEDASASIVSDASRPGAILIPEITARLHGGRIAGSAQSHTDNGRRRFWVDMHGSDVRAAPVFDDLLLPEGGLEGPPVPGQETVQSAWSVTDDYTRGLLDMDVSLSGVIGDPASTAGRGVIRVAGGSVIALPGLINLIEFSNLRAPFGATLDLAEAVFYIDGTSLAFERLAASSSTVEILGFGTLDWTDRSMDLRFRSRSLRPVPILSGLFETLRDELITTRIAGRPGDIRYSADSFSGTRRLVSGLLGDSEGEQERVMDAVERASRGVNNRSTARNATPVMPARGENAWADPSATDR
ncbi:MAG: hypothetical protein AAGA55_03925 [Planctomycetota bacterium]